MLHMNKRAIVLIIQAVLQDPTKNVFERNM